MKPGSATYKKAGVDVGAAGRFIHSIEPLARLTRRAGLVRGIGGFGGLFGLKGLGYKDPVLVASADGVGTKLKIAQRAGWYTPLGVDLVAMNVNDILCTGAEPLFFLDYIAAGRLDPKVLVNVVRGVVRGCVESHCVLLGGETAQMGLLYKPGDFDLAGFAVGIVEKKRIVSGEKIKPGDRLVGLASNGIHANGYSLVQKVLSVSEQKRDARELLKPTRIYVRAVLDLLRRNAPVKGIAHITGGSFREKLARILPGGTAAVLRKKSWPVPPVFRKIRSAGVGEQEMYRTFNMGIGMVLAVPAASAARVQARLKREGMPAWIIGEITKGHQEVVIK
ncbi:MAG: phosphoribosylformylglycinamidine cyclo-ligase [Candidatus Omnitrophota bacterium]|nr:phosphoribosylformylglycinamidine cyclo-ligase [Candidatus Omnitrophota bacterium]